MEMNILKMNILLFNCIAFKQGNLFILIYKEGVDSSIRKVKYFYHLINNKNKKN